MRGFVGCIMRRKHNAVRRVAPKQLGQAIGDGFQRVLSFKALSVRPTQMACQHHAAPTRQNRANRGQTRANAAIIADDAVGDRHIEIDPHKDPFPLDIDCINSFFSHEAKHYTELRK